MGEVETSAPIRYTRLLYVLLDDANNLTVDSIPLLFLIDKPLVALGFC